MYTIGTDTSLCIVQVAQGDLTGLNSPEFGSSGRGGKRKRPSEEGVHAERERTAFSLSKMGLPGLCKANYGKSGNEHRISK